MKLSVKKMRRNIMRQIKDTLIQFMRDKGTGFFHSSKILFIISLFYNVISLSIFLFFMMAVFKKKLLSVFFCFFVTTSFGVLCIQ